MRFLKEVIVTITTAGTPVALDADGSAKKVIIYNNYTGDDTRLIAAGEADTVDGTTTPPKGKVIYKEESMEFDIYGDPEDIYLDSDVSGTIATVHYYGD